jgi:hypothetical protein
MADNLKRIKEWADKNRHMLEYLSPEDIVIAWIEYSIRTATSPH